MGISINLGSENAELAKYIYRSLSGVVEELKGVITSYETAGKISILVACSTMERPRLEYHINLTLSNAICTFFKQKFLEKHLSLPQKEGLELFAFKKALIFFDRETDRFLVAKFLILDKSIELESFFHFRLRALQEKWTELASIANENASYLLGEESFVELLKFLIDNIDFETDEIFVRIDDNISLLDRDGNLKNSPQNFSRQDLVEFLLTNSPRKIYWKATKADEFLEKIFSKRIVYRGGITGGEKAGKARQPLS